jgi:hypothetical protein
MIKVKACADVINNRIETRACLQRNVGTCAKVISYNGTANYEMLKNLPQINGTTLIGNIDQQYLILLGNGLDFDQNSAIEIQNGVIFDCGTSVEV